MEISITGIAEVQALLTAAPKKVVKRAFTKALIAACIPVVSELEVRTPVSADNELFDAESFSKIEGTGTGKLKSAIMSDVAIHADGIGGTAQVGFGRQGKKARLVEMGHRMVGHKPGLKDLNKPVPPNPFMAQAFAASVDAALQAFADAMLEALRADI